MRILNIGPIPILFPTNEEPSEPLYRSTFGDTKKVEKSSKEKALEARPMTGTSLTAYFTATLAADPLFKTDDRGRKFASIKTTDPVLGEILVFKQDLLSSIQTLDLKAGSAILCEGCRGTRSTSHESIPFFAWTISKLL